MREAGPYVSGLSLAAPPVPSVGGDGWGGLGRCVGQGKERRSRFGSVKERGNAALCGAWFDVVIAR